MLRLRVREFSLEFLEKHLQLADEKIREFGRLSSVDSDLHPIIVLRQFCEGFSAGRVKVFGSGP